LTSEELFGLFGLVPPDHLKQHKRKTSYIQCKNHVSPVGVDVIRELNGVLPKGATSTRGVVVCPSGFTADAISFAKDRSISLWDRHHLFELIQQ